MEWLFTGIFGLIFGFFGFIIWLIPFIIIGTSRTTYGGEKAAWLIIMLFFWFAWIFYMLLAPLKDPEPYSHRDKYN